MRIDKFLWCVRLFPTRSAATEACRSGRVQVADREVKPAAEVAAGAEIAVRVPPIWKRFEILALPTSRVGAKLVPGQLRETTPFADLEKLELAQRTRGGYHGEGRPTKRDRRDLERFSGE
ncbi:MAG: RNA-binding S4 domain-containing protein [Flavobacteriales bacterium]|nr:MAG: RNA-binding S4 domain-containing protein [Flavobacteriales bacterium]